MAPLVGGEEPVGSMAETAAEVPADVAGPPVYGDFECPLCHELLLDPCVPSCGHAFCRDCLGALVRHAWISRGTGSPTAAQGGAKCPVCRRVLHVTRAEHLQVCRPFGQLLEATFPEEYARRRKHLADVAAPAKDAPEGGAAAAQQRLPLFVLDATLPLQHLHLNVFEPRYITMVRRAVEGGGCLFGMSWSDSAPCGVEVEIIAFSEQWDGRLHLEVVGRRPFRVVSAARAPEGFLEADVEYFDMDAGGAEDDGARQAAEELPALLEKWEKVISEGGWQRRPGHLALVKEHLGPVPGPERPGALAAWVVALANPLPALGVAPELRPALLCADSPLERVSVAKRCLEDSLAYVDSVNNSLIAKALSWIPGRLKPYVPMLLVALVGVLASKAWNQ